jgi:alkanesulfonate monooxygenase SsuD/methylene tetrahydromethanopterin reductase-like flavin-dependent oxidoreductase (luciferase family)
MIRIGVNPGQWGWQFEALEHSWQQAEGLGFDAISCFDHVAAAPRGWAAWDAPSLLTAIALRTERAAVCVNVINASLRHPLLLAGQLAVAQAASRGRLEVGLGAGAAHLAPYDFEALGQTFAPPERRREVLAHLLEALPALWRGETVTDSTLDLQDASLGPIGIPIPPLIVGGRSRPLLELAARHADGWNAVISHPRQFARLAERLDSICTAVGRTRPLARTAQVFLPGMDLARMPEMVRELGEAGADTAMFVIPTAEGSTITLERLAAALR